MNRILKSTILVIASFILMSCNDDDYDYDDDYSNIDTASWASSQWNSKVLAHRGYWNCSGSVENSIASLTKAAEIGVYGVEFDLRITKDSVLVLNHDETYNGFSLRETNYSDIVKYKLDNGETIPTLEEYLTVANEYPELLLQIDMKYVNEEEFDMKFTERVVEVVDNTNLAGTLRYCSGNLSICKKLVEIAPEWEIMYSGSKEPSEFVDMGFSGLQYHYSTLQEHEDWVDEAHSLGFYVCVWSVNDEDVLKEMALLDVDYILSDKPVLALTCLQSDYGQ